MQGERHRQRREYQKAGVISEAPAILSFINFLEKSFFGHFFFIYLFLSLFLFKLFILYGDIADEQCHDNFR